MLVEIEKNQESDAEYTIDWLFDEKELSPWTGSNDVCKNTRYPGCHPRLPTTRTGRMNSIKH